ncbi:hypothetical protein [Ferrovibrio sp.]|uniref:hypothetical protein n=1 Tax=Ferrovibrio sp. TaxID=1917215 RepID=UPI0026144DE0|nr:hypothetical protein [Ferrovibrio sp.]
MNEVDVGRLNGPNQVSIREVEPGSHTADMIRAGLFGDKSPKSAQQRELQSGETWYLRVNEHGVNCRIVSDAETLIMSGVLGLMASKMIDGPQRRQCEYYNPELTPTSDEVGRAAVNEIVYGVASPTPRLAPAATAQDAGDGTPAVTLEQVRGEWERILPALKRHAEREIGFYDSILFATPGRTRVLEWKLADIRTDEPGRLDLVVQIVAESLDVNRRLSTQIKLIRYGIARDEQAYVVREASLDRGLVMAAQNTPAAAGAYAPAPSLQDVKANWTTTEQALRRHFERNGSYYESIFVAEAGTLKPFSFIPHEVHPAPDGYLLVVSVGVSYRDQARRLLSSASRDMIYQMGQVDDAIVVHQVSQARGTQ